MKQKTSIFHYSNIYSSLERVIRLKIVFNMADPTYPFGGYFVPVKQI